MITFHKLYSNVLVPILSEWITDEALCRLDCAICNKDVRNLFLSNLSQCSLVNYDLKASSSSNDFYSWVVLRGMKLKKLNLNIFGLRHDDRRLKVLLRSAVLNYLETPLSDPIISLFLENDITVDTLKLLQFLPLLTFNQARVMLKTVRHLDLSSCLIQDYQILHTVVENAPQLGEMSILVPHLAGLSMLKEIKLTVKTHNISSNSINKTCSFLYTLQSCSSSEVTSWHVCKDGLCFEVTELYMSHHGELEEEVDLLRPYIERVRLLNLNQYASKSLIDLIAAKSCMLVSFTANNVLFQESDLIMIFRQCGLALRTIEVSVCEGVTDSVLLAIARYNLRLTKCRIAWIKLQPESISALISGCQHLEALTLSEGVLQPLALQTLTGVVCQLLSIDFEYQGTRFVLCPCERRLRTDQLIYDESFFVKQSALIHVSLKHNRMRNKVVEYVARHCPNLQSVVIGHSKITSKCFVVLKDCQHLTSLNVEVRMEGVTDSMIENLLKDKPYFVRLSIPLCSRFTCAVLHSIARYCPLIRHIRINNSASIVCNDVHILLKGCHRLNYLDLFSCSGITDEIFPLLESRRMRHVNLTNCNVTKAMVMDFASRTRLTCCNVFHHSYSRDNEYRMLLRTWESE